MQSTGWKWPARLFATTLLLLPLCLTRVAETAAQPAAPGAESMVMATPALVREIQFMLLSLGIDPGPIDGVPKQLTNRAVRMFEEKHRLPPMDIAINMPVTAEFLAALRRDAAGVLLPKPEPVASIPIPPPPPLPAESATPPEAKPEVAVVKPPPPDPYASCAFSEADFRIGGRQFTPQAFIDEGFGGSTSRAVTTLRLRLGEAREFAERIGGTALGEVQRQARVLAYLECRLKIEQGAGKG